jgi:hypothetical protein
MIGQCIRPASTLPVNARSSGPGMPWAAAREHQGGDAVVLVPASARMVAMGSPLLHGDDRPDAGFLHQGSGKCPSPAARRAAAPPRPSSPARRPIATKSGGGCHEGDDMDAAAGLGGSARGEVDGLFRLRAFVHDNQIGSHLHISPYKMCQN